MRPAEIAELVAWITAIDFAAWPQQHRLEDGLIRPAMVTDLAWHGFGKMTDALVASLTPSGFTARQRMLSVVMPGHSIPRHADEQPDSFRCRVHVPLTTNDRATFNGGHMALGFAHEIDTRVPHEVVNAGATPRIHLMFDIHV
jgi:hypothetical protein